LIPSFVAGQGSDIDYQIDCFVPKATTQSIDWEKIVQV
jgi:hypothetical protein